MAKERCDRFTFPPSQLTLYLAKNTNGPWLKCDDEVDKVLLGDVDTGYIKMKPLSRLHSEGLLGLRFQPEADDEIHILVRLPPLQTPPELRTHETLREMQRRQEEAQRRLVETLAEAQRRHEEALAEVQRGQEEALAEALAEVQRGQEEVKEVFASLKRDNSSRSYTDGKLGSRELQRLKKLKLVVDAPIVENEDAFWSTKTQEEASGITNEAKFDAFITPFFNKVVASCGMDLVFVNSERYPWLSQGNDEVPRATTSTAKKTKTDLKPDGFVTHRGMYHAEPAPKDQVDRVPSDAFRFGKPDKHLYDSVILFESKLTLGEDATAAFGQVVRSLEHFYPTGSATAILFDRHGFSLVTSFKRVVTKVVKAKWVDKGSKALFRNFITDNMSPWVTLLADACSKLNVNVVEGDAFLGLGAHGRVFKVIGADQKVLALKIVEKNSRLRLYKEKRALTKAQHTGLTVRPVGDCIDTFDGGAALLLSPVGEPLPRPKTRQEVEQLFGLLWQLHEQDLVHGDPRVPNVILQKDSNPLWIDLVEVRDAFLDLKETDAQILTKSILRTKLLDPALTQLIDDYGKSVTQENLDRLAEGVWQKKKYMAF